VAIKHSLAPYSPIDIRERFLAEAGGVVPNLTLEDIAKEAGVSRSTVSRVVNDNPHVRDDVRQRVRDVIDRTGYRPHAAARTLASQRSLMLGLVVPRGVRTFFTDPYFLHLTQGLVEACNQYNYTLGLFLAGAHEEDDKVVPRVSRPGFLDGILIQSGARGDQLIQQLMHANLPLVVIGRPFDMTNVSYIDVDNIDAARNAVLHLIRLGYKRIATIAGPRRLTAGEDRLQGYRRALRDRGMDFDPELIVEGDFTEAGGYEAMSQLLPHKPDAVFAASDIMAVGAMRAVRDAGLSIPDDIAMVGFDDISLATLPEPPLTTVHQPVQQFGKAAIELLLDLIENGIQPPRRVVMVTELKVRQSCGASRWG
jgi:LacI family transcriptional regulator